MVLVGGSVLRKREREREQESERAGQIEREGISDLTSLGSRLKLVQNNNHDLILLGSRV